MPFPFLAPLSPWIVDIMKQREENPNMTTFKSPWVVMTSGALVVKGSASKDADERRKELIKIINEPGDNSWKGCIIANNSHNIDLTYATGKTPVGIDFTGKPITVEGESGRKISTPIIQSIEIDTDGANNTLKTARISVKCFTLKQLEMFELFFLKPGMNVLVEWGDNSLLKQSLYNSAGQNSPQTEKRKYNSLKDGALIPIKSFTSPEEALVPKDQEYDKWCEGFSEYYRSDTEAISKYLGRIEKSLGTYDLVAGKVLDYSFSIAEDNTYDVSLEISQGNQISLAIPHSTKTNGAKVNATPADKEFTNASQIVDLMVADLNLGDGTKFKEMLKTPHPNSGGKWENEWFNFLKINKQQKDTIVSDTAYVSLRFILGVMMNYVLVDGTNDKPFFHFNLPTFQKKGGANLSVLPVTSNRFIMSSTDKVIFPTDELPKFIAPAKPDPKKPASNSDENKITISKTEKRKGLINGYNFHTSETLIVPNDPCNQTIVPEGNENVRLGDALNIFIKYEEVVKAWNSTYTRIDFLEKILSIINMNSYGLFTLIYGISGDNGLPTVIDAKMSSSDSQVLKQNETEIYRFKPTTILSNVRQFSFNFEMSNLVAGRQIFNSGKLLQAAKDEKKKSPEEFPLPAAAYKAIDNATMGNADGWYSINNVELKKIQENFKKAKAAEAKKVGTDSAEPPKPETSTTEATDLTQVIATKSVNFYLEASKSNLKDITLLIFKDEDIIYKAITNSDNDTDKKSTLSPIDVTITIDGFSGFTPGQYFKVDGIPEIYNQIGVFQITNIKHSVQTDGWTTTIEAGFRIVNKK